jgi:hypothetical protein
MGRLFDSLFVRVNSRQRISAVGSDGHAACIGAAGGDMEWGMRLNSKYVVQMYKVYKYCIKDTVKV